MNNHPDQTPRTTHPRASNSSPPRPSIQGHCSAWTRYRRFLSIQSAGRLRSFDSIRPGEGLHPDSPWLQHKAWHRYRHHHRHHHQCVFNKSYFFLCLPLVMTTTTTTTTVMMMLLMMMWWRLTAWVPVMTSRDYHGNIPLNNYVMDDLSFDVISWTIKW